MSDRASTPVGLAVGQGLEVLGRHVVERPAGRVVVGPPSVPSGSRARLKSRSIGMPSAVTSTFDGLMSRCRTPRSWACSSASASRAPHQAMARAYGPPRQAPSAPTTGRPAASAGSSRSSASTRSAPRAVLRLAGVGQDLRQGDPAEIGHAEQVQAGRRVDPVRVDRDDVRVLEPGQGLRLARARPRDLQRHRAGRPAAAPRARKTRANDPAAQLLDQEEAGDRLAGLGERRRRARRSRPGRAGWPLRRSRADEVVDVEHPAQRGGDLGESRRRTRPARGARRPPRGGRTPRR